MNFLDWLTHNSAIITTIFFFTMFVGIAIWAYLPKNKDVIQSDAMIPFHEQEQGAGK